MRRKIIPYNPKLKLIARELRNHSTSAQIMLWLQLKGKQMHGYDFHRQKPIGNFILDFFCNELMLGIELADNLESAFTDNGFRKSRFETFGISVLTFTDDQVLNDIINVLSAIESYISEFEKHTPNPSQEGKTPRN